MLICFKEFNLDLKNKAYLRYLYFHLFMNGDRASYVLTPHTHATNSRIYRANAFIAIVQQSAVEVFTDHASSTLH